MKEKADAGKNSSPITPALIACIFEKEACEGAVEDFIMEITGKPRDASLSLAEERQVIRRITESVHDELQWWLHTYRTGHAQQAGCQDNCDCKKNGNRI